MNAPSRSDPPPLPSTHGRESGRAGEEGIKGRGDSKTDHRSLAGSPVRPRPPPPVEPCQVTDFQVEYVRVMEPTEVKLMRQSRHLHFEAQASNRPRGLSCVPPNWVRPVCELRSVTSRRICSPTQHHQHSHTNSLYSHTADNMQVSLFIVWGGVLQLVRC